MVLGFGVLESMVQTFTFLGFTGFIIYKLLGLWLTVLGKGPGLRD